MKKYKIEATLTDADDDSDCDNIMDYVKAQLLYDLEEVQVHSVTEITDDGKSGESVSEVKEKKEDVQGGDYENRYDFQ